MARRAAALKELEEKSKKNAATTRQYYERVIAPKKAQVDFLCNDAIPLDRNGTIALPKLPKRKLVDMYFN
eukprot:CAMPEP_0116889130 /NCGR_PEP_ID=MMETSP0463-20121206/24500_1 /TAXON_ID=181622 /ORGANISM="Strombidinopsis sp, Strain SopsisLIS2011" /LENGTH=69 /DNA_ID=CAMNT_0004555283 /DNA_START=104 /DNA_END=313 /DNA_ORIENTATION=-